MPLPPTAPASDKATAPLAIAAAAIAAASSVTGNASTGTPTASGTDAGVAATPAVAKAAGVKIEPQAGRCRCDRHPRTRRPTRQCRTASRWRLPPLAPVAPKTAATLKGQAVAKDATTSQGEPASTDERRSTADRSPHRPPSSPASTRRDAVGRQTDGRRMASSTRQKRMRPNKTAPDRRQCRRQRAFGGRRRGADTDQSIERRHTGGNRDSAAAFVRCDDRDTTTQLTVTAATHAAVPLSGLAVEIAASAQERQEPLRNPARSGRSRPHRRAHRRRSQRPGDVASDGREAGDAVDAAPGRAAVAARAGRCRIADRQWRAAVQPARPVFVGSERRQQSNPNAQRLIVGEEETDPRRGRGPQLWPHARSERRRRHQGLRRSPWQSTQPCRTRWSRRPATGSSVELEHLLDGDVRESPTISRPS